mgnify:FL=1
MWAQLEKKYGLESDIPSTFVTLPEGRRLAADDIWDEPAQTASAAKHETYTKEERDMWRERLRRFFSFYVPSKTPEDIARLMKAHDQPPDGYERMWIQLVKKFGVEPIEPPQGLFRRFLGDATLEGTSPIRAPQQRSIPRGGTDIQLQPPTTTPNIHESSDPIGPDGDDEMSALSTADTERLMSYSPMGHDALACSLHALLRIQGSTAMLYERAEDDKKTRFRKAVEAEVAINLGVERRQVSVLRVSPGMAFELQIELSHEQVRRGVGDALVTKVLMGTFTVKHIREAYQKELGDPIQIHAEGAAIYGGSCTPQQFLQDSGSQVLGHHTESIAPFQTEDETLFSIYSPSKAKPPITLGQIASGDQVNKALRTFDVGAPNGAFSSTPANVVSPVRRWSSLGPQEQYNPREPLFDSLPEKPPQPMRVQINSHRDMVVGPGSFLRTVWGDQGSSAVSSGETNRADSRDRYFDDASRQAQFLDESDRADQALRSSRQMTQRIQRESAKPMLLSLAPSTDNVLLPTRTAPPTVTRFPPGSGENYSSRLMPEVRDELRGDATQIRVNNMHVRELMNAIQQPPENAKDAAWPRRSQHENGHADRLFGHSATTPRLAMGLNVNPRRAMPVSNSPYVLEAAGFQSSHGFPHQLGAIDRSIGPMVVNSSSKEIQTVAAGNSNPYNLFAIVEALEA